MNSQINSCIYDKDEIHGRIDKDTCSGHQHLLKCSKTPMGYHLIKCNPKKRGRKEQPLINGKKHYKKRIVK
jgi:hypothetical protein